ncbi:MAG: hypothetical protein ABSH40_14000 [Bryobacteraceae bacterium]|jgi:hypothetical protein
MAWGEDHHDGRLLARLSQRRHQAPLPVRPADSQVFKKREVLISYLGSVSDPWSLGEFLRDGIPESLHHLRQVYPEYRANLPQLS